jgi:ABC-type antimicrobial peptide transport system permease subunit
MSRTPTHGERVLRRILWGQAAAYAVTAALLGAGSRWFLVVLLPYAASAALLASLLPRRGVARWFERYEVATDFVWWLTIIPTFGIGLLLTFAAPVYYRRALDDAEPVAA